MEHDEQATLLHREEMNALKGIYEKRSEDRPKATKIQYQAKQDEFFEWLTQKGYVSHLVTDANMTLFLSAMQNRPTKKRGRKRKIVIETVTSSNDLPDSKPVSEYTVMAYVNAIMDAWKQQYTFGNNPIFPNRPDSVK